MNVDNLFNNIPADIQQEVFTDLLATDTVRIERIISKGQSSPKSGWYDQDENEWVIVIQGKAKLLFEQDNQVVELNAGSYININAHTKHKVHWTCPEQETIWLAVFYK